jgi:hypothetical protein
MKAGIAQGQSCFFYAGVSALVYLSSFMPILGLVKPLSITFMKTDLYTKVILTVIAIVLTLNLLKGSSTPAMADTKKFVSIPVNPDGSINVNINKVNETMDVNIKSVDRGAFYYVSPIPVKVNP